MIPIHFFIKFVKNILSHILLLTYKILHTSLFSPNYIQENLKKVYNTYFI